ncbi:Putative prophage CPS-53 integrase [Luteitalea pratensis]|uniref:Prophage CPS-53 integrase n=1 Tax=Luteitalea pratensis TaxID=1855912 RepID=A0A143PSD5_LUTPR|nr:integrase arm-type DNA-binding domain-containing protein [Luteitalea pratensis]AMY11301.1 Putative prophage CPS-53 integrase [Luteitalea pratensis]
MRVRLTDQRVTKLLADNAERKDVWDAGCEGLSLRIGPDKAVWVVRYRVGRVRRRLTIGNVTRMTLAQARAMANKRLLVVDEGRDPVAEIQTDRANTFEALAEFYIEHYAKPRKKSWANDQRIITRHLMPDWRTRLVSSITRRDVRERIEHVKLSAPVQANRVKALCSKLFGYALEHDWIEANPVTGITLPTKERARKRVLTKEEVGTFWNGLDTLERDGVIEGAQADQLRLRLLLGQRGGEIAAMRWQDIAGDLWTQPDPKNGRTHVLPVTPELREVLTRQRARVPLKCVWVFPNSKLTGPDIYRAWRAVEIAKDEHSTTTGLEALGVADAKGHDLRRACATHMAILGVHPHVIGRLLNHADALGKVAGIYNQHSYLPELRQALHQWAEVVRAAATAHGHVVSSAG